ncbi:MAG: hypothetical protein LBB91_01725 [Clostridiales bacterium]|jgi:hypothetical protein|nr:hypothetical protein [Clostridiales bacterium]
MKIRALLPLGIFTGLALLLWLTDSWLFFRIQPEVTFFDALWAAPSAFRVLIRSVLALALVAWGWQKSRYLIKIEQGICFIPSHQPPSSWGREESSDKSQRLLFHSLRLAEYFKMPLEDQDNLRSLCYCYDLGKVALPQAVLDANKRSPLQQDQWDDHVFWGAEIAAQIPELAPAAGLIKAHHEAYNGSGILGFQGEKIPIACRIFRLVWLYDGLTHPGRSRKALVCNEALQELTYYSGTLLDPLVVEAFHKLMSPKGPLLAREKEFSWQ